MALTPIQQRALDPFSDHRFSQIINRLSRIATGGINCVFFPTISFPLTLKDTSTVTIGPGICVKDDVFIHMTEDYDVLFDQNDYYEDISGQGLNSIGDYYMVVKYDYSRQFPTPKANYKIIKNISGLFDAYPERYIFLGKATIIDNGGTFEIDSISDHDIANDRHIFRIEPQLYNCLIVDGGEE